MSASPEHNATLPPWQAWFDGACGPTNPGTKGIGALLLGPDGGRLEISQACGHGTNNEAEYEALIAVLDAAVERGVADLVCHGDSQLVIEQCLGRWSVKSATLADYHRRARTLIAQIPRVRLVWIPREKNTEADELSKRVYASMADDEASWGNVTQVGAVLGLSAVAVGKRLDAIGLREQKWPSTAAVEQGLARVRHNGFGKQADWHLERVVARLSEAATPPPACA